MISPVAVLYRTIDSLHIQFEVLVHILGVYDSQYENFMLHYVKMIYYVNVLSIISIKLSALKLKLGCKHHSPILVVKN